VVLVVLVVLPRLLLLLLLLSVEGLLWSSIFQTQAKGHNIVLYGTVVYLLCGTWVGNLESTNSLAGMWVGITERMLEASATIIYRANGDLCCIVIYPLKPKLTSAKTSAASCSCLNMNTTR